MQTIEIAKEIIWKIEQANSAHFKVGVQEP
jgi:hypothetical protein